MFEVHSLADVIRHMERITELNQTARAAQTPATLDAMQPLVDSILLLAKEIESLRSQVG